MTGGNFCSVAICKSNSKRAKAAGERITFFSFPKDVHLRDEWVEKCYRNDQFNPENKRVCSKHFRPEDYEDAVKARVMGHHPKKLKKNAVPSILLLPDSQYDEKAPKRGKKRVREDLIKTAKQPPTPSKTEFPDATEQQQDDSSEVEFEETIIVQFVPQEDDSSMSEINFEEPQEHSSDSDTERSTVEIPDEVLERLKDLEQKNEELKKVISSHKDTERSQKERISKLEKRLEDANAVFEEKAKTVFKGLLTKNQIEVALRKKARSRRTRNGFSR